ncbi:MAG TPA: protein kinase [Longimicrobiales bacterium]|nr:protein kinase [Longimicrobiales bacterium]
MSRIFVAEELSLRRRVVIKVLPPETVPTGSAQRFQREIELAAQLQHPHIVPLLAADAVQGSLYYTMPFVSGESLRERLAREGALPLEDALRIWRDVLEALAHAHASGVIHRDVKPGNILLSGRNALVTDFGIAGAIERAAGDARATAAGLTIGTPAYMAPEQAAGRGTADSRIDVYAAGLVMYEMLTGSAPFTDDSTRDLLLAHLTREPPPLHRGDAPRQLLDLVMRCLEKEPAARPQSADAVLAELDCVAMETAPALTTAGSAPAADPLAPRRPRRAAAFALASVAIAALVLTGIQQPGRSTGSARTAERAAGIAVLPLTNLSADPGDAALAAVMTQELTSILGRNTDLRVIASTSVLALASQPLGVSQIADSLQVSHVLEGSLQKAGSRLRMQVRLVEARDGATRWSETYDREFADVFAVQEDIARAIADELAVRLTDAGGAVSTAAGYTPNIAAYEWYLRGMDVALLRGANGPQQGIEFFERAIAIDSTYADAYAGLVRMYIQTANGAPAAARREALALARDAAFRAVALNDRDADAHAALGWYYLASAKYRAAEPRFKRAIALDPGVPRGHEGLARAYMAMGRPADQLVEARRGVASDPFSHSAIRELALALALNGRCEDSLEQLAVLKTLTPPAAVAGVIRGQCYASRHLWPEAIAEFRWAHEHSGRAPLAFLGYALARSGRPEEAASILADLLSGRQYSHGPFGIAVVYAGMGDYDQAFAWLDRALAEGYIHVYIMHPMFRDLHRDPRFARLRDRMDSASE